MHDEPSFGTDRWRLLAVAALVGLLALLAAPAISWLPEPGGATTRVLGPLLAAQAAIAALTLAVTTFVLQGVGARRDAVDRVYHEYVRRSWAYPIFYLSLSAAGVTGAVLVGGEFVARGVPVAEGVPGFANLTLVAVVAFAANLVLAVELFRRGLQLTRPDEWRKLRREVDERSVRSAVDAFLARRRQVDPTNGIDPFVAYRMPPPANERSADEAIGALVRDARRAMTDGRDDDFEWYLASARVLFESAMDQLKAEAFDLDDAKQPRWPPLQGLRRRVLGLGQLREDVIARGGSWYANEIAAFDRRLAASALRWRCHGLFEQALLGYATNYWASVRAGNHSARTVFRRSAWPLMQGVFPVENDDEFPYLQSVAWHQAMLLVVAMQAGHVEDFRELRRDCREFLRGLTEFGGMKASKTGADPPSWSQLAEQDARVALMDVGGIAMRFAQLQEIEDAQPYLDAVRGEYRSLERLASDAVRATTLYDSPSRRWAWGDVLNQSFAFTPTDSEEMEPALDFFVLRLLELVTDSDVDLDLDGHALVLSSWFANNRHRAEPYVRLGPDESLDRRRELVRLALEEAVRRDEIAAVEEIIARDLSPDLVAAFTAEVYASVFEKNAIERVFTRLDAFHYVDPADDALALVVARASMSKDLVSEVPEHLRVYYPQPGGMAWGQAQADGAATQFRKALAGSPTTALRLDSSSDILQAVDHASARLGSDRELIVLATGDWARIIGDIPAGYELERTSDAADWDGEHARYLGIPIVVQYSDDERCLHVVEPGAWGCFMRAQVEGGTDLLVRVEPVTAEQARAELEADASWSPGEPDEASRLREMQTLVSVTVAGRTGFRVTDPSRAIRITAAPSEPTA